jgi:hypothetical protein
VNIPDIARNTQRAIVQNSPLILTGVAVAGVLGTAVAAVLVTPEAIRRIDLAYDEKNEDKLTPDVDLEELTKFEMFKAAAPCYIPAALIGGTTIAAIIFSHQIGARRQAALIGAYSLAEKTFSEYKAKTLTHVGENEERKIREAIVEDRIKAHPMGTTEVVIIGGDEQLFFDEYSGRYFKSTINKVERAANEVNKLCNDQQYASLNEFYGLVGLSTSADVGNVLYWTSDNHCRLDITTIVAENDQPAFSLGFKEMPTADLQVFH